jgi:hypothetical protein
MTTPTPIEKAMHRLAECALFERATIESTDGLDLRRECETLDATDATVESLALAAVEIETAFRGDNWRVECSQFILAASIMLRPSDAVSAFMLDATASHTARLIAHTPDESLAAVWAVVVETAKGHHNRRAAKDEWKLILWSVTAGWGDLLGAEPEHKRG